MNGLCIRLYVFLTIRLFGRRTEHGASAVEYALLIVAAGILFGVSMIFFDVLRTVFRDQCSQIGDCQ